MRWLVWVLLSIAIAGCGDESAAQELQGDSESDSDDGDDSACDASTTADEEPLPEAVCCGCLCADPLWSCSEDTCVTADGKAHTLVPEAGFLEIPHHAYAIDGAEYTSARHRMWYAFRPAQNPAPETPLLVVFNGGPGAGTGVLFGANTHELTLDPQRTGGVGETERPWTDFAHVLYVDPIYVGFSYALPPHDGVWGEDHDASMFLHVAFAFIERHPALANVEIIPLGESYGGLRAMVMLEQVLNASALADASSSYQDGLLHEQIEEFREGLPRTCDDDGTGREVSERISRMVSIQGSLQGFGALGGQPHSSCVSDPDHYACQHPSGWQRDVVGSMLRKLRDPAVLTRLTGVDVSSIAWMHATERAQGIRAGEDEYPSEESAMRQVFGELPAGRQYYIGLTNDFVGPTPDRIVGPGDSRSYSRRFVSLAAQAGMFITNARYDLVIDSSLLPAQLELAATADLVDVTLDTTPRDGVARPGWLQLRYWSDSQLADDDGIRRFRFPSYESGHTVTLHQPTAFADDLRDWIIARENVPPFN